MVAMCFFGLTINYIDRSNLSVALPKMKTALHLGPSAEGVVLAAFFASYAVFQLPAGRAVDRFGEKIVNAITVAWWALFTALTAATQNFGQLIAARLRLRARRGRRLSRQRQGSVTVVPDARARVCHIDLRQRRADRDRGCALPLVAALVGWLGWRGSFIMTGALSVVWVVFWLIYCTQPRQNPAVSPRQTRVHRG